MSKYTPEPPTSGKVRLNTTSGPIQIQLWCNQAPLASRNFIQLCLQEYYNNLAFYRIIPDFLVQTGDPSQTGQGGTSIYQTPFADQFHSRLKFSHRGILAMATTKKNQNKSIIFFTLDKAPELNYQHTIFGKIVNDTFFNLLKIGESQVDKNDRPLVLPRIINTEVLLNPFDDIMPRQRAKKSFFQKIQVKKKKAVSRNLLSFDSDQQEVFGFKADPRLKQAPKSQVQIEKLSKRTQKTTSQKVQKEQEDPDFDNLMKLKVLNQQKLMAKSDQNIRLPQINIGKFKVSLNSQKIIVKQPKSLQQQFQSVKSQLLKLKKRPRGSNNPQTHQQIRDQELFLSPLQLRRYKYYQKHTKTKGRQSHTIQKLNNFLQNIKNKQEKTTWFSNPLKFSVDSSRAYSYKTQTISQFTPQQPAKRLKRTQIDPPSIDELYNLSKL